MKSKRAKKFERLAEAKAFNGILNAQQSRKTIRLSAEKLRRLSLSRFEDTGRIKNSKSNAHDQSGFFVLLGFFSFKTNSKGSLKQIACSDA